MTAEPSASHAVHSDLVEHVLTPSAQTFLIVTLSQRSPSAAVFGSPDDHILPADNQIGKLLLRSHILALLLSKLLPMRCAHQRMGCLAGRDSSSDRARQFRRGVYRTVPKETCSLQVRTIKWHAVT
jgi:hypothetical protein